MALPNWSAPSALTNKTQEQQALAFTQILSQSKMNFGVLMSPVFHYKAHQKHVLEHVLLTSLSGRGVDVDTQASLLFKARADSRDTRPLVYPLRLVRSCSLQVHASMDEHDSDAQDIQPNTKRARKTLSPSALFWSQTPLASMLRTEEAEQIPSQTLKQPEDLTESALPSSTDETSHVRGGKRFEQIGIDAASKMLESLLESNNQVPDEMSAIVILDLSVGVGDFFYAWLRRQSAVRFPLLFVGANSNATEAEWLRRVTLEEAWHSTSTSVSVNSCLNFAGHCKGVNSHLASQELLF